MLVELLRASGIPAYFVYGTVEMPVERARVWLDVKDADEVIEAFQRNGIPAKLEGDNLVFEHVWVEAYIPFEDGILQVLNKPWSSSLMGIPFLHDTAYI